MNTAFYKRKGALSSGRRQLYIFTLEGVPANVVFFLLGNPFQTGFLLYLGASSTQIGIVMAIPALAALMQICAAFAIQRFENRKAATVIFASLHRILWTATGLIPLLLPHQQRGVSIFILLFLLASMCNSFGGVFWSSLVSDAVPAKVRGRYFGIRNMIHTGVGSLTLIIGGAILDKYKDVDGGIHGFYILYAICALFCIFNIILLICYPNPPFEKSAEADKGKMLLKPFRDSFFLKAMLFISAWALIQGIAVPLFSFVMLDILKVSYAWVSIITTLQNIIMMISYYVWGTLNAKYSTRSLLLWALPIIALSCVVWGGLFVLPVIPVLLLAHLLLGMGLGGYNLLVFNFTIGDTPKKERPMYIAVFSAITGTAGFMGPMLGGKLYKLIHPLADWVKEFGVSVSVGICLLLLALTVGRKVFMEETSGKKSGGEEQGANVVSEARVE